MSSFSYLVVLHMKNLFIFIDSIKNFKINRGLWLVEILFTIHVHSWTIFSIIGTGRRKPYVVISRKKLTKSTKYDHVKVNLLDSCPMPFKILGFSNITTRWRHSNVSFLQKTKSSFKYSFYSNILSGYLMDFLSMDNWSFFLHCQVHSWLIKYDSILGNKVLR